MAIQLTEDQLERYARNLVLPGWGMEAQKKLAAAKVLVIGAGGLGSPCLLQLVAAGVGNITLVEGDDIEWSNLNRQLLHGAADVGRLKVESATEKLMAFEPQLELNAVGEMFTPENALELMEGHDVLVDCSDNYATRFLANDAAVLSGTRLVHGSIFRYEGQVTVIAPGEGPCLRCVYPEPPAPGTVPSGKEAGVPGFAPGIVGAMQAAEVVKVLIGLGEPLIGRLLVYDCLSAAILEMNVERDPGCPVCGDEPSIISLS